MTDYISREEAYKAIYGMDWKNVYFPDNFKLLLDDIPSADVVEVVRCKDCINYEWMSNRILEEQTWFCHCWNAITGEDDYCSFAKRRANDDSDTQDSE